MFRFIHIPKNGGTAVTEWLRSNQLPVVIGDRIKGHGKHRAAWCFLDEDIPRYCTVRSPYTRIISYYNYVSEIEGWTDLNEFVQQKLPIKIFKIPSPWVLQKEWTHHQGNLIVDKIFHYETMEQELKSYFNLDHDLPKSNVSEPKVTLSDLTAESRRVIAEHFQEDFETFGYPI